MFDKDLILLNNLKKTDYMAYYDLFHRLDGNGEGVDNYQFGIYCPNW
jgi:hypothetical protein